MEQGQEPGFGNAPVTTQAAKEFECTHGRTAESCWACRAVRRLIVRDDFDRRLGLREWVLDGKAPERRRQTKRPDRALPVRQRRIDQFDARAFQDWRDRVRDGDEDRTRESPDEPPSQPLSIRAVFPDVVTVRLAVQHGLITPRQAALLEAWITVDGWISWHQLGREAGTSRHTAKRELERIVRRFVKPGAGRAVSLRPGPSQFRVVRVRGSRRLEAYIERTLYGQAGDRTWTDRWRERVPDQAALRSFLRRARPEPDRELAPIPRSPMRHLIEALVFSLSSEPVVVDKATRGCLDSPDWKHNRRWAELRMGGEPRPWSVSGVLNTLVRGCPVCEYCHTPILVGCRLNGHEVTKGRRFCDAVCKMRWKRRPHRRLLQTGRYEGPGGRAVAAGGRERLARERFQTAQNGSAGHGPLGTGLPNRWSGRMEA